MEVFLCVLVFITGTVIGSFLTLAIHRIPRKENIIYKNSYCPHCEHPLAFLDLLPIVSFILLKGKCRYCDKKIKARYLLLEILSGLSFLLFVLSIQIDLYNVGTHEMILVLGGAFYLITLVLLAGIDRELYTISRPVFIFGMIWQVIYMVYLYIVGQTNIYRYSMYFILILILLVTEWFLCKKKEKKNYCLQILMLCMYIAAFTSKELFFFTASITFIWIMIDILWKRLYHKEEAKELIPIGYCLCVSNIVLWIAENFLARG